jgi:hypothetical protein
MYSKVNIVGELTLPLVEEETSIVPFDLETLKGLPVEYVEVACHMVKGIVGLCGTAYFTIHGKVLKKSQTLRRGAPHTDGNYEPINMSFGGGNGGWKIGQNGPDVGSPLHKRQYDSDKGGIILVSNFESCYGWIGEYEGLPLNGGDCSHIKLNEPFMLEANKVYYGNNHFIHESLPVSEDVHRVMVRITLPEDHKYLM